MHSPKFIKYPVKLLKNILSKIYNKFEEKGIDIDENSYNPYEYGDTYDILEDISETFGVSPDDLDVCFLL